MSIPTRPHTALSLWTPDEVAECLPVSRATSARLWELLPQVAPQPASEWPEPVEQGSSVVALWPLLTEAERKEINEAYTASSWTF